MADPRADNLHSRLVFWLKILLPMTALALLATLFLFGRTVRPEDAIPYADSTVADRARQPRLTGAAYAGMTQDGSALTIRAAEAVPGVAGTPDAGTAKDLSALVEMPGGGSATVTAGLGRLDQQAQQALLTEGVRMTTSTGYTMLTDGLSLSLDQTEMTSLAPVYGSGPAGTLQAHAMHLGRDASGGYLLDFTGGVTLVYTPKGGL